MIEEFDGLWQTTVKEAERITIGLKAMIASAYKGIWIKKRLPFPVNHFQLIRMKQLLERNPHDWWLTIPW